MTRVTETEGRTFQLVGGTLFVDGAAVTVSRDGLVLDVSLEDVDGHKLEMLCVKVEGAVLANIPIG